MESSEGKREMTTPMKTVAPTDAHTAFRDDMLVIIKKHGEHLRADEILALAAHAVGQIMALQDQQTMTPRMAIDLVCSNIEKGNAEVVDGLDNSVGGTPS